MLRRWRLWLSLVFVVVIVGVGMLPVIYWPIYGWLRGEEFYQGMPTSWWDRDAAVSELAAPEPYVPGKPREEGKWVRPVEPSLWRTWAATILQSDELAYPIPQDSPLTQGDPASLSVLIALLHSEHRMSRAVACGGLIQLGPAGKPAVPLLVQMFQDRDEEMAALAREAVRCVDPNSPALSEDENK